MNEYKTDYRELLSYIDPSGLSYADWLNVGMALSHEGESVSVWENWSRRDSRRFHDGECEEKWRSFRGASDPVTGATIMSLAKAGGFNPGLHGGFNPSRGGFNPQNERELDWDDVIGLDATWIEEAEIKPPSDDYDGARDMIRYLETLFEAEENVGYVTKYYEKDGKYRPTGGLYDRSAGKLIEKLAKCHGDIGSVLGDVNPAVGAWVCFNPLDGKGRKNENVTDYRYALVESDLDDVEKQYAIIRELRLPVAALVHSGNKSLHAIVRIEAGSYDEYKKRVEYLYAVCTRSGLTLDSANKNPSRLSRLPGVARGENFQYLLDTDVGAKSFNEWREYIESITDELPDPENLALVWGNLPDLAPPLIDGVLRQGHKMLLAGPSKAGKSYALIELCIAIAEGRPWLNFTCAQGRIMYVNLELDRASCLHRFRDVYDALGVPPDNLSNIDIWNLRGSAVPMDKLAPKLIRRAAKKNYLAIIIDPIYKVITGDENSADQMANFCNQFDKICHDLGCAVIYCHHHSKGYQGAKRAMDRASGSGVFARDPDALLDLIELEVTDSLQKQELNRAACEVILSHIERAAPERLDDISDDDRLSQSQMWRHAQNMLAQSARSELQRELNKLEAEVKRKSAWRIDGTLREFAKFPPVNVWFDYPIHKPDEYGALADLKEDGEIQGWQKAIDKRKTKEEKADERKEAFASAYEACKIDGKVTVKALAEYLGKSEKTVRSYAQKHESYWVENGIIGEK